MGLTNNGKDAVARSVGGDPSTVRGTASGTPTATTLDAGSAVFTASSGGPPALGGMVGHIVVANFSGGAAYGVVISNTTQVLTVDAWRNPADPEPATVATPSATPTFIVVPGGAPCFYMGVTSNATAFSASDATLASEIWTSGGGIRRRLATWAHTNGTATYTLSNTFTVNGSDTGLPITVAKIGVFQHYVNATVTTSNSGIMLFETVLSSSAVLSASGDNVQITDTITLT